MQRLQKIAIALCVVIVTCLILTFVTYSLYIWIPLCIAIWVLSVWLQVENRNVSVKENKDNRDSGYIKKEK